MGKSIGMLLIRSTIVSLLLRYRITPDPEFHALPVSSHLQDEISGVRFERSVVSLRPKPALIARASPITP